MGVHLGVGGAGELQTPNAINSSQGETRAPGLLCEETADPWGRRPLLAPARPPCASRLVGEAKITPTRRSVGTGCPGHSAPLNLTQRPTERTCRRALPREGPRCPVSRARPPPHCVPKVASLQRSWVVPAPSPPSPGASTWLRGPWVFAGRSPCRESPIEGRRAQERVGAGVWGHCLQRAENWGVGAGTRPVCRGRGWPCPPRTWGSTVVPGLGSVQARRPCPSSGPLFRVWAPSGLPSTRPDSVSVPTAHHCPRGGRSTNLYGPPRRSLWGAGSPRGVGGEA